MTGWVEHARIWILCLGFFVCNQFPSAFFGSLSLCLFLRNPFSSAFSHAIRSAFTSLAWSVVPFMPRRSLTNVTGK